MAIPAVPTAYAPVKNTVADVPGWPKDQTRYAPYDKATPCSVQEAVLTALVGQINSATSYDAQSTYLTQLMALTVAAIPNAPTGTNWQARNCAGGGGTGGDGTDVITGVVLGDTEPIDGGGSTPIVNAIGTVTATGTATTSSGQSVTYVTVQTS